MLPLHKWLRRSQQVSELHIYCDMQILIHKKINEQGWAIKETILK